MTTLNVTFSGKMATRAAAALCAASLFMGAASFSAQATSLDEVIAGDHRSEAKKARDKFRHPKETLEFFGLKADMTVVEIWPGGGGWYQEILAPYLNEKGQYIGAGFDLAADSGYRMRGNKQISERFASNAALYGKAKVTELAPPAKVDIAPAGSADMVVSFRNFHNWQMAGTEKTVLKAIFKALKPGGIFGMTDHRSETSNGKDGYIKPSELMAAATEAGFVLVDQSEVNANPKDTHNHERGVWTLPPRLAGNAENHDAMRAIGESDRLTYKFMKPAK